MKNNTGIPYRIIAAILRKNGFVELRKSRSTHQKWRLGNGEYLIVRKPVCNRMIWRRLVKEHKLIYIDGTDYRK